MAYRQRIHYAWSVKIGLCCVAKVQDAMTHQSQSDAKISPTRDVPAVFTGFLLVYIFKVF